VSPREVAFHLRPEDQPLPSRTRPRSEATAPARGARRCHPGLLAIAVSVDPAGPDGAPERCEARLRGDLDLATADGLRATLDGLRAEGHRTVVVDLAELRFLSAVGLTVLAEAQHELRAVGGALVLARPTPIARRMLQITGLDASLTVQP
jgi:anti-anti-sigma factor